MQGPAVGNEFLENKKYKDYIENKLSVNEADFCTFRKEKQLDYIFASLSGDFAKKNQQILDLCCGYGRLIYFLNQFDGEQFYHGIDYTEGLIKKGQSMFQENKNISFELGNAYEISKKYQKHFDISIMHKTLSWLPYYKEVIPELIKVTKNKIYVTSLFSESDVDFICKVKENPSSDDSNYLYMNTYSLPAFTKFCLENGAKSVKGTPMKIDVDLPKSNDKSLSTYTVKDETGNRLEFTGAILLNWMLVEIDL